MALTIEDFKEQLNKSIINADVVKIFDNLLTIAVEEFASDIHIEPSENFGRIRLRIDGLLSYPYFPCLIKWLFLTYWFNFF